MRLSTINIITTLGIAVPFSVEVSKKINGNIINEFISIGPYLLKNSRGFYILLVFRSFFLVFPTKYSKILRYRRTKGGHPTDKKNANRSLSEMAQIGFRSFGALVAIRGLSADSNRSFHAVIFSNRSFYSVIFR